MVPPGGDADKDLPLLTPPGPATRPKSETGQFRASEPHIALPIKTPSNRAVFPCLRGVFEKGLGAKLLWLRLWTRWLGKDMPNPLTVGGGRIGLKV